MRALAFIVPWRETGRWLWNYLPHNSGVSGDICSAAFDSCRLPPYVGEFVGLARFRFAWARYDMVFTWEMRCALAFGLWRKGIPGSRRPRWIAVGPILKGPIRRLLPLVRALLRDADRIVCFSRSECDACATLLRLPRERFVFLPLPWQADGEHGNVAPRDDGFICALGQSGRDYPTLLRAIRGTNLPVRLVAGHPSALGGEVIPPNVQVQYRLGPEETSALVASATFHCIPLHASDYSAGQNVLLRAMAQQKAVVISDTPGIRDYVIDGETGLLVPPGDTDALREALLSLWNDSQMRQRLGENAARVVRDRFGFARFLQALIALSPR